MAHMLTYGYRCTDDECGFISEHRSTYDDRMTPQVCHMCAKEANYTPSSPMVMEAAWPDGHRRKNDPNWQKLARSAKLRVEKVSVSDQGERQRIQTEINKVNGVETKKTKKAVDLI